jgi:Xaa-Pro aminopeptidase
MTPKATPTKPVAKKSAAAKTSAAKPAAKAGAKPTGASKAANAKSTSKQPAAKTGAAAKPVEKKAGAKASAKKEAAARGASAKPAAKAATAKAAPAKKAPAAPAKSAPPEPFPFKPATPAQRCDRLRAQIAAAGFDGLLLHDPLNVLYLSGLKSSNAYLWLTATEAHLLTDPRYAETARLVAKGFNVHQVQKRDDETLKKLLAKSKAKKIGFEPSLAFWEFAKFKKDSPKIEFEPADKLLPTLRRRKDSAEIDKIARSQALNEEIFRAAIAELAEIGPGRITEREFASVIKILALERGLELAFEPIVASGLPSSRPHYEPSSSAMIEKGPLLVDMGVKVEGYCSDMTRMAHVGPPSEKFLKLHALVNKARAAAIKAVKPGVEGQAVHDAAVQVFKKEKLDKNFTHGLGHGLGLYIHEQPSASVKVEEKLEAGDVITIEPGLYLEGWGGIRIEDLVVVTNDGCENLTKISNDVVVI